MDQFLSSESTCETWVCYQDDSAQSIGDKKWQKIAQKPESGQIGIFMKTAKNFCGNLELTINNNPERKKTTESGIITIITNNNNNNNNV